MHADMRADMRARMCIEMCVGMHWNIRRAIERALRYLVDVRRQLCHLSWYRTIGRAYLIGEDAERLVGVSAHENIADVRVDLVAGEARSQVVQQRALGRVTQRGHVRVPTRRLQRICTQWTRVREQARASVRVRV